MDKRTVLLILVDGLRHDYINPVDSPFLHVLAKQNIEGIVRETFAFELRPAFFAGLQPEVCDIAHMFYYNPAESPFRSIDLSHGDRSRISHDLKMEAVKRNYSMIKHIGNCAEIPLPLLKYFDFSEKYHTVDPSALGDYKTLFDYLRSDGKKWLWIAYPDGPGTTSGVLEQFFNKFTADIDFIYLHFSELDWIGHEYGPHTEEQRRVLREIDEAIRGIYENLNQTFTEVCGIIFGDHGQVEVKKLIDIESKLKETNLTIEKDYIYFLDSTQARFWFYNDRAMKQVAELLRVIPDGKILTEADYERLHFRFKHNKFGELIFVMNEGIGIFPNFFQRLNPCKGLHGYLPEVEGNWAKLIITGCGINKHIKYPLEMVDIFPTLLDFLDQKKPSHLQAKSVFEEIEFHKGSIKYKASIVMPTYNRIDILKKNILAIENQTCPKQDFELIVVDDGSTDGTTQFLEEYKRNTRMNFKYLKQDHSGPAAARNKGIRDVLGHIIILTGDDMIMSPDFIENHLRFHQDWPQTGHACLGFIDWAKDIEINPLMKLITSAEGGQQFSYDYVETQDPEDIGYLAFLSSNISLKRLFCLTHGLFNDKVFKHAMWEDIELGYRLERAGLILHFRKNCRVYHDHGINFEGFAERQRMVGWYSHDLANLGVPVGYPCRGDENGRLYSKRALTDIVAAVKIFEKDCEHSNMAILNRAYNSTLNYASLVGYKERENNLRDEVGGVVALLYNLSLADDLICRKEAILKQKEAIINQSEENINQKDEQIRQLQEFADKVKSTLFYKIYQKVIKPFKNL